MTRRSCRREHGFISIELVAGIGLLLFPVAILVMMFPTWAERQTMVREAAREASRTYVLTGDCVKAQNAMNQIAQNHNLPNNSMTLNMPPCPSQMPLQRSSADITNPFPVTATVSIGAPVLPIGTLGLNGNVFTLSATHSEAVDNYRSLP